MAEFGFYPGYGLSRVNAIVAWLGKPDFLQLHGDIRDWPNFISSMRGNVDESEKYTIDDAKKVGVKLQITQPAFPRGGNITDAAAGKYNGYYDDSAKAIDAALGDIAYDPVFRCWVEWNGRWMLWSAYTEADGKKVAAGFRHQVDAFRRYRPKAIIDWNYNRGEKPPMWGWPGDDYVDVISWDGYIEAQYVGQEDGAAVFERFRTEAYGLDWLANFARSKGKLMAISETGLKSVSDKQGAAYLRAMRAWCVNNLDVLAWVSPFLETFDPKKSSQWEDVELRAAGNNARPLSMQAMAELRDAIRGKQPGGAVTPPVVTPSVTTQPPVVTPPADPVLDLLDRLNADSNAARGRYPDPTGALVRQVEHWSWAALAAAGRKNGPVPAGEETNPTKVALAIYERISDHAALDPQAAAMIAGWVQDIERVLDGHLPDRETPDPAAPPALGELEALKEQVASLTKELAASQATLAKIRAALA